VLGKYLRHFSFRFVGWSSDENERNENDLELEEATKYLEGTWIVEVAAKLDENPTHASSQDELIALIHYYGINIRYLGLLMYFHYFHVFDLLQPANYCILLK
jgi:hypothetical protein